MAETRKVGDPGNVWEEALNAVYEDKPDIVKVRNGNIRIGDLRKGTLRFITDKRLSASDEGDPKSTSKYAAALVINSWWGLRAFFGLWWSIKWRWYYYIKQYTDKELLPLMLASKKSGLGNSGIYDEYHISDRDEGHRHDKDKGGSKTYPSREHLGAAWSTAEKFPHLTASRYFVGGLVEVRMWLYYWGMTERQVDLILCDQPLVVYDHDDKKSGGSKKKVGRHEFGKPSAGDMLDARARFAKKHGLDGSGKTKLDLTRFSGAKSNQKT